jgi:hypothetical protein
VNLGFIALLAVAALLMTPLRRIVIASLFGKAIGKAALAKQPDTIRLVKTDAAKLRNASSVQALAAEFQSSGFESAGVYSIPEMPGVNVQLLASSGDSMAAAIYDHPAAGVFYDIVSRYRGGDVYTHSTAHATGLHRPPYVHSVNAPGIEPLVMIEWARRERPKEGLKPCNTSSVAPDFVAAYAEYVAWMKGKGISTAEVVEVAKRKAA